MLDAKEIIKLIIITVLCYHFFGIIGVLIPLVYEYIQYSKKRNNNIDNAEKREEYIQKLKNNNE